MSNLKKLAEIAGVDVSTVSRALNDSPRVKAKTKELIQKLAVEYNYIPDEIARGLVAKKTDTIGIIVPEFRNTFYSEIIEGIESVLSKNGYSLIFGKSDFLYDNEMKYLDLFLRKRVDGIIGCSLSCKALLHYKKNKRSVPLALADTYYDKIEFDSVSIDNYLGIKKIIEYLKTKGHTNIGFLSDYFVTNERLNAFKKVLCEFDLTLDDRYIIIGEERNETGGYIAMKELLNLENMPTAIVAATDNLAIGAIRAIREANLSIPKDISIIGFDDITVSSFIDTPLTTVVQPKFMIGSKSAELLLERISNPNQLNVKHIILEPHLILRNSVN